MNIRSAKHRERLPQLDGKLFLTDGGIETVLIFHEGIELPLFAAFDLLKDDAGIAALRGYYEPYAELAEQYGAGFVLESPTWRASSRWAGEIGHSTDELEALNRRAIELMEEIREEHKSIAGPVVISGCVGPQDDGYQPAGLMSAEEAERYHSAQIETFAGTAADMVTAVTITYVEEALGIARAAAASAMPVAISFTVETDGRLPSGQALAEAIERVDAETDTAPAYFMINCAHPSHFDQVLEGGAWLDRIRGLRANASMMSHAELDQTEELDEGDPADLGVRYAALRASLPNLNVLGGCCGTDHRHVSEIAAAWPRR